MAQLEPGQDFNGSFVDENIRDWYSVEQTLSLLFSIAAAIAIVLSCSGLLAMVLLVIQQRVKEIGVRKVLGASVRSISLLISKEFLWLVGLAVLIATPIAWLADEQMARSLPLPHTAPGLDVLALRSLDCGGARPADDRHQYDPCSPAKPG